MLILYNENKKGSETIYILERSLNCSALLNQTKFILILSHNIVKIFKGHLKHSGDKYSYENREHK